VLLAYLDDSDTKAKQIRWQVMSAVIIRDDAFKMAKMAMSTIPERLMGLEKLAEFKEFHACELYGGYGPFQGIDQERRFEAISHLLALLQEMDITIVYGAVDLDALQKEVYGSADPVDVCFRKCLSGIRAWARELVDGQVLTALGDKAENYTVPRMAEVSLPHLLNNLVILIVDDCDAKTKSVLQQSFRSSRPPLSTLLDCFHDDIYFGDSRYSIGIQLADMCSYFIARHLEGNAQIDCFYQVIEPRIYPRS
jgi:hypothetical protein